MRRGFDGGQIDEAGKFAGFGLGADHCAEHEWGVQEICASLGVGLSGIGVEKRTITKVPKIEYREWLKGKEAHACLIYQWFYDGGSDRVADSLVKGTKDRFNEELGLLQGKDFSSAWDARGFGVVVKGLHNVENLCALKDAFDRKDVAIWVGGSNNPFQNGGLCLVIASRITESHRQLLEAVDLDSELKKAAADSTGIVDLLSKRGKRYYALSPEWARNLSNLEGGTKYPVMFWLNPQEQNKYRCGWFTVEELTEWAEDKGTIIKTGGPTLPGWIKA